MDFALSVAIHSRVLYGSGQLCVKELVPSHQMSQEIDFKMGELFCPTNIGGHWCLHRYFYKLLKNSWGNEHEFSTLAAVLKQNLLDHLITLMIWHNCLIRCWNCKKLSMYVMILPRNIQCNSIKTASMYVHWKRWRILSRWYSFRGGELKWVNYARQPYNLITWNCDWNCKMMMIFN